MPETVTLRDSQGRVYGVPQEQSAAYLAQGFRPETDEEHIDRTAAETFSEQHGGVGGAIASGVAGGLSGLTLGLSDVALGALGADRTLRHLESEHPYATGIGTVAGALLPVIATGGAAAGGEAAGLGARILAHSPAGLVSKAGGAIGGLGEGAGLAGRVAAGTAAGGVEGALYGGGQYLTETALEDKPLSAEGFVAGMGHGALFGAPIGAVGTVASATLQRARSLFPRSEVSAAAAAGVQRQAASAIAQASRDGDLMVAAAERKLSDVDAQTQMAQAGETVTRRVFGEAHPAAMADQVTGAVDRQQITQALDGYQHARQQMEDWLAAESDPELARALVGLQHEGVQAPMPSIGVPTGEFGAPGARGFKSQDELARLAMGTPEPGIVPALEPQATRQLRAGAKGTPVGGVPEVGAAPAGIPDHATIRAHEVKADDYLERTVSAREIADRGYYEPAGAGTDAVRVAKAKAAIAEGQREPIKLNVSPEGKITVTDGRHRLAAAIDSDSPIKVKWSTGVEPAEGDVFRGAAPSAAPTESLTGQLRGMQEKIGSGEGLKEMGSPARAEYAAATAEARFIEAHLTGSGARPSAAARGAGTTAEARIGSHADLAELLGIDLKAAPTSAAEYGARREAMGLPGALERAPRKTTEERAIAKAIMRHNGNNVDIGPNLARGAKVFGDMEEASARLTDVLGSEAPPTAVENAKAYRAAIRAQSDASAASSAKAGADLKTRVQPALDATAVDSDITKALRAHDMRNPAAVAPAGGGLGRGLADVGSALEVMRAIGAHVPAISHIPVIGPILGLWLKARAVWAVMGRKGGSIGRSTEGAIAAKAAATRDRIVAATGAILEGAAKGAGQASHLAGPAVLLAGKLFAGGDKPDSDKPRDLFEARVSEIVRAQAPEAIDQAISQRFPTSDPVLHDALVAQVQRGISFLDSKRPKQTVLPGVLPGDGTWKVSMAAIDEFGKYVHAVNDPVSVLEDLAKGHPSAEGAETLRVVYPALYAYAQKELLEAASRLATTLPYSRRVMISILYRIPVDGTMQPSHAQYLQTASPPAAMPPAPSATGPLRFGQQTMTPLDQRASGG